jgi:hypothetical protein
MSPSTRRDWLDAALATIEHEAPAKVEPSDEKTLEEQEQVQEQVVMQVRRRLGMGHAAKGVGSHATKHRSGMQTGTEEPQSPAATPSRAVAQLMGMKAQYEQWTGENAEVCGFLRQLPGDQTAEPLGELYFRLTQLMREVEHLHGMRGQEGTQ